MTARTTLIILIPLLLSSAIHAQNAPPVKAISTRPLVIGLTQVIHSEQLGENRTLNIFLPDGYYSEDSTRYPVIYLLDGSADEDFIHVAGLVHYSSFPWVNQRPKSIVVGIATVDRKRDFTFPTTIKADREAYPTTGHSGDFISFIEKELQPYIQKSYKALPEGTLIGQSLGGLLATEILAKKPFLFNEYILVSPSMWWDNGSLFKEISALRPDSFTFPTRIYVGVGREGPTPTNPPRIMEDDAKLLVEILKGIGSKNLMVRFDYLQLENHATIMHQALLNAFRMLDPNAAGAR